MASLDLCLVSFKLFDLVHQGVKNKRDARSFYSLEIHVATRCSDHHDNSAAPKYRLFSHHGDLQDALVSVYVCVCVCVCMWYMYVVCVLCLCGVCLCMCVCVCMVHVWFV